MEMLASGTSYLTNKRQRAAIKSPSAYFKSIITVMKFNIDILKAIYFVQSTFSSILMTYHPILTQSLQLLPFWMIKML